MPGDVLSLPLMPLLRAFYPARGQVAAAFASHPIWGPRQRAIATAPEGWLHQAFLDRARDTELGDALLAFYGQVCALPCHEANLRKRLRLLRHGLQHWLRGTAPLGVKWQRCAQRDGPYFVLGVGRSFWAAVARGVQPETPDWLPIIERGLRRLGLLSHRSIDSLTQAVSAYQRLRKEYPELKTQDIDHFLILVASMQRRELPLPSEPASLPPVSVVETLPAWIRQLRSETPLRQRLCQMGEADVDATIPTCWGALDRTSQRGYLRLDDALAEVSPGADAEPLFAAGAAFLQEQYRLHLVELPALLHAVAPQTGLRQASFPNRPRLTRIAFHGFCSDTFAFLRELGEHNRRDWMEQQRERYRFAVRDPLVELCQALTDRYVRPVLCQQYGYRLETEPRIGKAISSICKNDYGRSAPYQTALWLTFYRQQPGGKREDVQFFVQLDAHGVHFGLRLGRTAHAASKLLRQNAQEYSDSLFLSLQHSGALRHLQFSMGDDEPPLSIQSPGDLRSWVMGKAMVARRSLSPEDPRLRSDDLVGEILLTFDCLLPAYVCAVQSDPLPRLRQRTGSDPDAMYDEAAFLRDTYLSASWLHQAMELLHLKRQLILQGVPGTGKTHVARSLARLLTQDRPDAIRLVQFHPSYCYEEFVEGIRARTIEIDGRTQVTYPVEDGLLLAFAAQAAQSPSELFVLIIDEINRGNLPRIFGELLYLLEYRDQAIALPYSKQSFQLPANLTIIGTMNRADRSISGLDQALRRRFSFLEMRPDPRVLAGWLETHLTSDTPEFGPRIVAFLERLNERLKQELGPNFQVGHSFLMVPDLDEARLQAIWEHHLYPLLEEYAAQQPGKRLTLSFAELWQSRPARRVRSRG